VLSPSQCSCRPHRSCLPPITDDLTNRAAALPNRVCHGVLREEYNTNLTLPSNRLDSDLFPDVNSNLGQGRGISSP
jgi:hypothetical protein